MPSNDDTHRFEFDFDAPFCWPGRLLGIHPGSSWVEVDDEVLRARFGRWVVVTPRRNVAEASITGPYAVIKTAGPAHLSVRDRGLTFATNARLGACLRFAEPVRGIEPLGVLRHPGLTVTVADPEGLLTLLQESGTVLRTDQAEIDRQAAADHLRTMSASDLRGLTAAHGVEHPSSASHHDLVTMVEQDMDRYEPDLLADADASRSGR